MTRITYVMFVKLNTGPHNGWRFEGMTNDPDEVEVFRKGVLSDIELTRDKEVKTLSYCIARLGTFSLLGGEMP